MRGYVYEPNYKIGHYLGLGAMLLMGVVIAWVAFQAVVDPFPGQDSEIYTAAVMSVFAAFFLGFPARQIREIRFGRRIVVKRYLWPSDVYDYHEIYHLSPKGIELESGSIRLRNVRDESIDELQELLEDLARRGRLDEDQLRDENMLATVLLRSVALWGSVAIGVLIAGVVWAAEFAEPIKLYVLGMYESDDTIRPFLMIATIGAVVFYFPLDRVATNLAEHTLGK